MANNIQITKELPFAEYIRGIETEEERARLKQKMMIRCGVDPSTVSRWINGYFRPDLLKRKEIAAIIRRHSGDASWTGDNLFPAEFYNNK